MTATRSSPATSRSRGRPSASWTGFSCRLAITPGSPFAAPLKMKWSPINVLPAPDGPATSVELPGA